jgi:hypothetical protein
MIMSLRSHCGEDVDVGILGESVGRCQRFGGIYCLHLQVFSTKDLKMEDSEMLAPSVLIGKTNSYS